jgi:hypothetical protein
VTDPLQGVEFRVFRSLLQESDYETVEQIRVYLTQGPIVPSEDIEEALATLAAKHYVEEYRPGCWKVAPQGYGLRRSLLGELPGDA